MSRQEESREQKYLMSWCSLNAKRLKDADLIYHVPNEAKRDARTGANLKAMGLKAGVPDLCLPVPKGKYHALYIELKAVGGRPSQAQKIWIERLNENNNRAVICYGATEAIDEIENYYRLENNNDLQD